MPLARWDPRAANELSAAPLYCTTDGLCLYYRDNTQALATPTAEQKAQFEREDAMRSANTYSYSYARKEVGVKITRKEREAVAADQQ